MFETIALIGCRWGSSIRWSVRAGPVCAARRDHQRRRCTAVIGGSPSYRGFSIRQIYGWCRQSVLTSRAGRSRTRMILSRYRQKPPWWMLPWNSYLKCSQHPYCELNTLKEYFRATQDLLASAPDQKSNAESEMSSIYLLKYHKAHHRWFPRFFRDWPAFCTCPWFLD